MAQNIEIKARLDNFDETSRLARRLSNSGPEVIVQEDIFFRCSSGRLKLRVFADNSAELIAYSRNDDTGPKKSDYVISHVPDPLTMRDALERAMSVRSIVRKTRHLYLAGRTRIHVDRVDGLGDFLELEVVMRPGEHETVGVNEARDLMTHLKIGEDTLIDCAYVDLIEMQQV